MIREVVPFSSFHVVPGVKSVTVDMDKEAFDYLLSSYKAAWALPRRNRYWGENITHLQLVKEILNAMERACSGEEES